MITKKSSTKKTVRKSSTSSKKKKTKVVRISNIESFPKNIEDELLKITNVKSVEQVKRPRKVALMIAFYVVIIVAILVFCLIRFSRPSKNDLLLKESIDYEYLTEVAETTAKKDTTDKEEIVKKEVETSATTKARPKTSNINDILPKYRKVIYDYPTYYQMSQEEIGVLINTFSTSYNAVKDNVFGENIAFSNKGANGILYLNYSYLKEFINSYTDNARQNYEQLPVVPYYNYIMNDKFKFDYTSYTTNLKMRLNFKSAKNQGLYYEIPATIYEPAGSNVSANDTNKINVRVLKRAKVGYTESFSLTALLEILDIECHTKHNPFFDIEDLIGISPKAASDMTESGFDLSSMIDEEIFNYVLFDKKGYITALYLLKS